MLTIHVHKFTIPRLQEGKTGTDKQGTNPVTGSVCNQRSLCERSLSRCKNLRSPNLQNPQRVEEQRVRCLGQAHGP